MSSFDIIKSSFSPGLSQPTEQGENTTEWDFSSVFQYISARIPSETHIPIIPENLIIAPNGHILAYAKDKVCIIDPALNKVIKDFKVNKEILSAAISTSLFYASNDGTVTCYDYRNLFLEFEIEPMKEPAKMMQTQGNSLYLMSENMLAVMEIGSQNIQVLLERQGNFKCFVLDNEKTLVGGEKIWLVHGGIREIEMESGVNVMCLSLDRLVVGLENGEVAVLNKDNFDLIIKLKGHKSPVTCLASIDRYIIFGNDGRVVKVWDKNYQQKKLNRQTGKIKNLCAINKKLYSAGEDNLVLSWKLPKFEDIEILTREISIKEIRTTEKLIIILENSGKLAAWSAGVFKKQSEIDGLDIIRFDILPDGTFLYAIHKQAIIKWDLSTFTETFYHLIQEPKSILCTNTEVVIGNIDGSIKRFNALDPEIQISTYRSHSSEILSLLICKDFIFSSSYDCEIVAYQCKAETSKVLVEHGRPIIKFSKTDNEKYFISASENCINIWQLKYLICIRSIKIKDSLHSLVLKKGFLYGATRSLVSIIDMKTWSEVARIKSKSSSFAIQENSWILAVNTDVVIKDNPMETKSIGVIGNSSKISDFLIYVNTLAKGLKLDYNSKMDGFLIVPYKFNIGHIYAHLNLSGHLKSSLENKVPLSLTSLKETALSLSISKDFASCVTVILRNLANRVIENPYCLGRIQRNLADLTNRGDKGLDTFYQTLMRHDESAHLPKLCTKNKALPSIELKKSFESKPIESPLTNRQPVFYYNSLVKLSPTGSYKSLNFIKSIALCSNSLIFKSNFIGFLLQKKWEEVRYFLYLPAFLYTIYLLMVSFYSVYISAVGDFLFPIFIINVLLFIYTVFMIFAGGRLFWENPWNIAELIRSVLTFIFLAMEFGRFATETDRRSLLTAIVFLSWISGINLLRLFKVTRVFVNCIKRAVNAVLPFFIVFLYAIVAFAFISFALNEAETDELGTYMINSYKMNLYTFDTTDYDHLQWCVFFLATIINVIIMLNLLISILLNEFGSSKSNELITSRKELGQLVFEGEIHLFYRRNKNEKKYLHVAMDREAGKDMSQIEEKLKDFKEKVRVLMNYAEESRECLVDNEEKIEMIGEIVEKFRVRVEKLNGKLDNSG